MRGKRGGMEIELRGGRGPRGGIRRGSVQTKGRGRRIEEERGFDRL